ncbi:MAG: caspase family protein [Chroococcidiopsidaceae cyanobacterium CP_BM_ER_R8_30]|nr:caspase family protein [Chroococcidiopsidaceae cyanobacterium CP_BM_ER_R8_30]
MCPLGVGTSRSTYTLKTGEAKLWVFLVGVNQYQDDSLSSLRYSATDCQGLGEALSKATQGFPRKEVIIYHDFAAQPPMLETVRASLQRIVSEAQLQDTILFYFSGHGVLDPKTQQAFLCLADTQKDNLVATGLGLQELLQMLGESYAYQQLICLDTCHSGDMRLGGGRGAVEIQGNSISPLLNPTPQLMHVLRQRAAQSKGFCALLSCDQGQQSWEFPELGHGVFTYYLMQGLLGEAADSQGVIDADGLYKYVYRQTLEYIQKTNQQLRLINQQKRSRGETHLYAEYPLQTPKRIVEGVGELILGIKPAITDSRPLRQAILVEGLGSETLLTLNQILSETGGFNLEYWPQPAKAWSEVRGAIQACLRRSNASERGSLTSSSEAEEKVTALLYLRGEVEEIEDGEAWLILGQKVRISRSWLRQELYRSGIAKQIVVLDCPGASSLSNWVEELQLDSGQGQCLIAAAAPVEEPELFSQVLQNTLVAANSQVGLPVAAWIAKLRTILGRKDIPLHTWLSGTQGVIEILPGKIASVFQDSPQPELPSEIAPAMTMVETPPAFILSSKQSSHLEQLLIALAGPIASTFLQEVSAQVSSSQELINRLVILLPQHQRSQFEQQAISLLESSTAQPQTESSLMPSSKHLAIDASMLRQCERELAYFVGPIASFLVHEVLESHPQISLTELVKTLAADIPDPQKALKFLQRLQS